jgi:hypothetical protein
METDSADPLHSRVVVVVEVEGLLDVVGACVVVVVDEVATMTEVDVDVVLAADE